ncbi:hypothetical protein M3Y95_00911600 [Aphelenchoides besseyi]|nr:hypothetical protein M3Y95_00911600 [Aphelenchoides besseyi]
MRQQLLWFLIGANVWTLVVTAGDPDCYESVGVDVKFDGNCRNTKSYLLIVGSEELEIHFNGNNNPSDHRAIDLNIGGCTLRVSYQDGEVNGAFTYKAHLITQATATSNQIKFANSEAPTKNCSVTFQPTKDKKYKVNVAVDQAQDKFSIVFMKASFDPSVTSGYPLWFSVLGAGAVMGVIVTVIICYKKNKKQKAPLAESKLPNVAVDPASKKHGHRSRHKKARSYRNKPIGHKKSIHHKKAHSAHERRVVAKNDEPKNDDPKNGEKASLG